MERYVTQLVEQLEEAKSRKPEMRKMYLPKDMNDMDEMIDSEMSMQKEYILEDIFGIPQQYFPPVEKLTDEQMEQLVIAILDLWREFHYAVDMPENIQIRHIYQELVSKWKESLPLIRTSNETIHIVLSDPDSAECAWPNPYQDEDIDDFSHMFLGMSFEAKRELFEVMNKSESFEGITEIGLNVLFALTDNLYREIVDADEVTRLLESWKEEHSIPISEDDYSCEFLGIDNDCIVTEEDINKLENLIMSMDLDPEKEYEERIAFEKKWEDVPYIAFWELEQLATTNKEKFDAKLKEYLHLYPNYSLIKLLQYEQDLNVHYKDIDKVGLIDYTSIFEGRTSITRIELFEFQIGKALFLKIKKDMAGIEAMRSYIDTLDLHDEAYESLSDFLSQIRVVLLVNYFRENETSNIQS